MLAAQVAAGTLPPVAARVPLVPDVAEDIESIGRPGGELRMLMASPKDTRIMVVYGYARLVAYTPDLEIVAGHPRTGRCRGRPHLHAASAPGPQMVRRAAVHIGGFPLLVRGRGGQQGAVASRAAGRR